MVVSGQKIETAQDARRDAEHCNQERYSGHALSFGEGADQFLRPPIGEGGGLKPDYNAWDVLDAYYADVLDFYYADHLSDAALEWLIKNKVIKNEQRGDAAAILSGISDWLERVQNE